MGIQCYNNFNKTAYGLNSQEYHRMTFPNNTQRKLAANFLAALKAQKVDLQIHDINFGFNENISFIYGDNEAQRQVMLSKICSDHGCSGYTWTKGIVVLNFGAYANPTNNEHSELFRKYPSLPEACTDHYVFLNKKDLTVVDANFNHFPYKTISKDTHFKNMFDLVKLGSALWEQHKQNPKKKNLQEILQDYQFAVVNNFGVLTPIIQ